MRVASIAIAVIAFTMSACAPAPEPIAGTLAPTPTPTPDQLLTTAPSTASPTATPRTVAFPDLPFLVGTASGDLYFALANGVPTGRKVHVCDSAIVNIVADGRSALLFCQQSRGELTLYLWDETSDRVTLVATDALWGGAARSEGGIVYATLGRYEDGAPISMGKLVRKDLRSGAITTIDERYYVANDIRPTPEGVAVWRAKFNPNGVRTDADAGTWLLSGARLTKRSQLRLVDDRIGRWAVESESVDPTTGYSNMSFCCTQVYANVAGVDQRLTPLGVRNEKALAMLDDGRVLAWRSNDEYADGEVVVYRGTAIERIDAGPFGWFQPLHSGDWVVVQTPFVPTPQLRAYRASDGAFAVTPMSGIRSLAVLAAP